MHISAHKKKHFKLKRPVSTFRIQMRPIFKNGALFKTHMRIFFQSYELFCINSAFFLISVPECTNHIEKEEKDTKKAGNSCNINELFSCGENQVCVQLEPENDMGLCQCLQGYDKQDDGVIIIITYFYRFST